MSKRNPCFGCLKRRLSCHTYCKEGQEWAAWNEEQRRIRNAEKGKGYFSEFAKRATIEKIKGGRK